MPSKCDRRRLSSARRRLRWSLECLPKLCRAIAALPKTHDPTRAVFLSFVRLPIRSLTWHIDSTKASRLWDPSADTHVR